MLNALVENFAQGLPREYAEALNSQLRHANEAEVEAFWWAHAASSNQNLLLHLLQSWFFHPHILAEELNYPLSTPYETS